LGSTSKIENIITWKNALGATKTNSILHFSLTDPGSHTLLGDETSNGCVVKVLPLDETIKNKRINLVKLDLEGYEYEALKGMTNILSERFKPILLIEFSSYWLLKAEISPVKILDFLEEHEYSITFIDDLGSEGMFELKSCDKQNLETRVFDYNLLCMPNS